jgi:hypothetical protein
MRPGRCSPAHLRNRLQRPPGGQRGKDWRRPSQRRGSRWSSAVALRAAIKTPHPQFWGSSRDGSSSGSHGGSRRDPAGAAEEEGEKGRGGTDPRVADRGPDRRVVTPARHVVAGVERGGGVDAGVEERDGASGADVEEQGGGANVAQRNGAEARRSWADVEVPARRNVGGGTGAPVCQPRGDR